jgi:hypothetical protein
VDINFANDILQTLHHVQPKTFFTDGIKKLVERSNKRVKKLGDYIEKWHNICSGVPFSE